MGPYKRTRTVKVIEAQSLVLCRVYAMKWGSLDGDGNVLVVVVVLLQQAALRKESSEEIPIRLCHGYFTWFSQSQLAAQWCDLTAGSLRVRFLTRNQVTYPWHSLIGIPLLGHSPNV